VATSKGAKVKGKEKYGRRGDGREGKGRELRAEERAGLWVVALALRVVALLTSLVFYNNICCFFLHDLASAYQI